jgi:hypothetical protein
MSPTHTKQANPTLTRMNRLTALMLCSAGLISSCTTPPPPPPPPCPPAKKAWCPPTPKPAPAANPRLRQVGDRVIEDVPPEEVEPVKSVLDIKR